MKSVRNSSQRKISFPLLGIGFEPNEMKIVSDSIAQQLKNSAVISVEDAQSADSKGRKKIIKR